MLNPPGRPKDAAAARREAAQPVVALLLALVAGGGSAISLVITVVGAISGEPVTWLSFLNWFGMLTVCVAALSCARLIGKHAHSAILSVYGNDEELQDMGYVLYLRHFKMDGHLFWSTSAGWRQSLASLWTLVGFRNTTESEATNEERILRHFLRFGRVIGVGRPGEQHPLPGAERFYLPLGEWQSDVSQAIERARLVVMVAGVRGESIPEGTLWEFTEILRLIPPTRLLMLVCGSADEYQRFKELALHSLTERAEAGEGDFPNPVLPDYPLQDQPGRRSKQPPLRGVVIFDGDWVGKFIRFDPSQERGLYRQARWRAAARNQIEPLLDRVENELPGHAVPAPSESLRRMAEWRLPLIAFLWAAIIPAHLHDQDLLPAQKVAAVALYLFIGGSFLVNGFRIEELRRRHLTTVSFLDGGTVDETETVKSLEKGEGTAL